MGVTVTPQKPAGSRPLRVLRRYAFFGLTLAAMAVLFALNAQLARSAATVTANALLEIIVIMPPIFVLMGLLDVWVPRELMVKHLGPRSGLRGIALAMLVGSAAAGPLYGAFPVAAVFAKKGASLRTIFVFLGAWSTTKIPLVLFEYGALGAKFTLTRLAVNIPGIIIMATILPALLSKSDQASIVEQAARRA